MTIRVQVLFTPGCPHAAPTGELICTVAREEDIHIALEERLVKEPHRAQELGFRGSPTVLVDGVDLEPWAEEPSEQIAGFG